MLDKMAVRRISNRIADQTRREHLRLNNEVVRRELVGIILAVTGWQSLDQFVEDAIDNILSGEPVNLQEFNAALQEWKLAKLPGGEG